MRMRTLLAGTLLAGAVPGPAAAQIPPDLAASISAGQVGERFDGYLGYRSPVSANVQRQAGAINIRRRTLYIDLARRRGALPQDVGLATGCELLAGVQIGQTYMLSDGVWRVRAAGRPAPVPDYCR
jgi:uncharacterized protein YdbL (DUF1318 family)